MALVAEDGTGVAEANAYETVANFKTYHDDRANSYVGSDDAAIASALIRASQYIDRRWCGRFLNTKLYPTTLYSRAVLTLTALPTDGETVTAGDLAITFRTTPALSSEAAIGNTSIAALMNLGAALSSNISEQNVAAVFADPDEAALTVQMAYDGISMTETLANGSFSVAQTVGQSAKGQRLEFPRTTFGMPQAIRDVTSEYALRALSAALAPDPTVHDTGLIPTQVRERVDVLEEEYRFSEGATPVPFRRYPEADALMRPYVRGGGLIR